MKTCELLDRATLRAASVRRAPRVARHFPGLADALAEFRAEADAPRYRVSVRPVALSEGYESIVSRAVRAGDVSALPALREQLRRAVRAWLAVSPADREAYAAAVAKLRGCADKRGLLELVSESEAAAQAPESRELIALVRRALDLWWGSPAHNAAVAVIERKTR